MNRPIVRCVIFLFLLLIPNFVIAIPIKGVVVDLKTREPLPYVNIWIKGTTIGVTTNDQGEFVFDQKFANDAVIVFSFIGYRSKEIPYSSIQNKEMFSICLIEESKVLNEVEVRPDNSYARRIIKEVIHHRKDNNPDNFKKIDYKKYTRESVFLSNLQRSFAKRKAFKGSEDAFIVQTDSTVAMPVFISEQDINYSFDKENGKNEKEIIRDESECVMEQFQSIVSTVLSGKMTIETNFYYNQVNIMGRGFPSPIAKNFQMYYHVYLNDSTIHDGVVFYKFNFYPKSYYSTAFKGYYWIDSETYALTEIYAGLPATATVNFVNGFESHVLYQRVSDKRWFIKEQKIRSSLSIVTESESVKKKKMHLTIQNVSDYYQVSIPGEPLFHQDDIDSSGISPSQNSVVKHCRIPYDSLEMSAYQGIMKLKDNKRIKTFSRFSDMALNGYYSLGKIDFGPCLDIYRKNAIEGDRLTLPLRTSEKLFENFSVGGYIGYGFKDEMIKYGWKINYKLPVDHRSILSLKYDNEYYSLTQYKFVEFVRENPFEAGGGNVMSSVTTRVPNPYMVKQEKLSLTLEYQFRKDIGLLVRPLVNRFFRNANVPFIKDDKSFNYFDNFGFLTDIRFSFNQPFDDGFFSRIYFGNQKPVIHLSALVANTVLYDSEKQVHPYINIDASLKSRVNFGPAYLRMMFNVGYISGKVPYPLLFMTRGTQDLGFARYHYNLLYNSSFIADLYTNVHLSLNGGGLFFGKLPGIKKLNLREVISFKSFWGQLREDHSAVLEIPGFLREPLSVPYMEAGIGITNIFKVIRIEYIRRLNQGDIYDQFSSKHGVRLRVEISF